MTPTAKLKVEFDTAPFERSHGRSPRGRGSWAFGLTPNPDVCNSTECFFSPGGMTLAEARKWAREVVADIGATGHVTLFVLP
jgi:hypothetical protein